MKASIPKRFLTLRDKKDGHKRSKSAEGQKSRSLTSETFFARFKNIASTPPVTGDDEKEKENAKVDEISKRLDDMDIHDISTEYLRYALRSKYATGDTEKALDLLLLYQRSESGTILPYDPNVQMVGAENRGNVTCFLDALLFAMFAKLEAFECMLKNELSDERQRTLAALIRLWVNMLRSGRLVHTDITQSLQDALAACGWSDAKLLEQQDTSEAFAFITETLQLPLLTLQVDLFHQGKGDKDDHKVVYERLLNLAVPADPEGKGIKLEDCLEEYFNTKVDVSRDGVEEKGDRPILRSRSTVRIINRDTTPNPTAEEEAEALDQVDKEPFSRRSASVQPPTTNGESSTPEPERPSVRHRRSTSIIQRIVLDDDGKPTDPDASSLLQKARRKGSTVVKAVTIPAWQFFRLIPWHSASNGEPQTDKEIVMHFNQRPVVGICLKRYLMTEDGHAKRQNTFIDIPDSLRLPHFMVADEAKILEEESSLSMEYKLVLQSVVCHRGDSVHSGHYISFARVNPKLLTDNRRYESDPPPDYEDAQWVKFDDLADARVTYVDNIKEALKQEMPYLVFYQIVPMVDVTNVSVDGSETEPPSYNDSTLNVASITTGSDGAGQSRPTSGYFDISALSTAGPGLRFSSDLERPPRLSLSVEEDGHMSTTLLSPDASRRGSVAISEPIGLAASTPDIGPSPVASPGEETTAQRLSRAAAKFAKASGRSRPTSQTGESRISISLSRLNLKSRSKEPLREAGGTLEDGEETPIAIVAPERISADVEKEHHHHHHYGLRGKSKNRSGFKDTETKKAKGEVPDRECSVM
ncbi:unnamed protein product [Discula destructiva]